MFQSIDVPWTRGMSFGTAEVQELANGTLVNGEASLELDSNPFPEALNIGGTDTPEQMLTWFFCIRYNDQPIAAQLVAAPSPSLAAETVAQLVALVNLEKRHSTSITGGACST